MVNVINDNRGEQDMRQDTGDFHFLPTAELYVAEAAFNAARDAAEAAGAKRAAWDAWTDAEVNPSNADTDVLYLWYKLRTRRIYAKKAYEAAAAADADRA